MNLNADVLREVAAVDMPVALRAVLTVLADLQATGQARKAGTTTASTQRALSADGQCDVTSTVTVTARATVALHGRAAFRPWNYGNYGDMIHIARYRELFIRASWRGFPASRLPACPII